MKIAISGAANTGKTTFANHFATYNKFPVIEERFSEIVSLRSAGASLEAIKDKFKEIYKHKAKRERALGKKFVSDRCVVDLMVFWMSIGALGSSPDSVELYRKWKKHSKKYDYIVFLPWGNVAYNDLEREYTNQHKHVMNPFVNLTRHTSMIGLANLWVGPEKTILLPEEIIDLDEQTEWLNKRLGF